MPILALIGALMSAPAAAALDFARVDSLDRVFPDRWPDTPATGTLHTPRNASVPVQFAVKSDVEAACHVGVSPLRRADGTELAGKVQTYHLLAVPVEANNNGGSKTQVGVEPREAWMAAFIRQAPFEVAEVMLETDRLRLMPNRSESILVDVTIPADARPGTYSGTVDARAAGEALAVSISVQVHDVVIPNEPAFDTHFWFWPQPENLAREDPPAWWSERHWRLLEQSGRTLREFGQNVILTPLINYPEPLIQTIRRADGTCEFDFSRFDRWVRICDRLGFETFAGHHIWGLPNDAMFGGVFVRDEVTGETERLLLKDYAEDWLAFIPLFYDRLQAHLDERGWNEDPNT